MMDNFIKLNEEIYSIGRCTIALSTYSGKRAWTIYMEAADYDFDMQLFNLQFEQLTHIEDIQHKDFDENFNVVSDSWMEGGCSRLMSIFLHAGEYNPMLKLIRVTGRGIIYEIPDEPSTAMSFEFAGDFSYTNRNI